jgi:hypothetical protein
VASENWHAEQLSTRGKLSEGLASTTVLVIGAGALGAPLAELLVRAGVQQLTIIDDERLEMGNLTRHPLGLDDLKTPKASALATRLNLAAPHAAVEGINVDFPPVKEMDRAQVQRCDVILDCTGHDAVLHYLEHFPWCGAKHFFSISLGLRARRLFCFTAYGTRFPHLDFRKALEPWLKREIEEYAELELPREGVGCWHPVFPARVDDIWMLASVAVKYIESIMSGAPMQPELTVFEQQYDGDVFTGIRRVHPGSGNG